MARLFKKVPNPFLKIKLDFEKRCRRYWLNRDKTLEERALYKIVVEQFIEELSKSILEYEQELADELLSKDKKYVLLGEYGKKVEYDEEAKWINIKEMNGDDFLEYDRACNAKFLNREV